MRVNIFFLVLMMFIGIVDTHAQNRSGVYRYSKIEANGSERWGEVDVKEVRRKNKRVIKFTVPAGVYNEKCVPCWCNGEIQGTATWTDSNVAEYNANLSERDPDNGELVKC